MRAGIVAGAFHTPPPWIEWTPAGLPLGTPLNQVPGWAGVNEWKIATDDVGETYLYHMMNAGLSGTSYPAGWSTLGVLTDVDVTAEVWGVATAQHLTIGPRVRAPEAGNYHSYQALVVGGSLYLYLQGPAQTSGSQRVTLASAVLPVSPSYMDRWYIRLQAIGTTIKAKAWPKQTPEPETWLITAEDATYASGYVGFTGHGRGTNSRAAWSLRVEALET